MVSVSWTLATLLLSASIALGAFDPTSNTNLVAYWGQNSFGATNPDDPSGFQTDLLTYCQQDTVDVFPLAFLDVFFGIGDLPEINFANICNDVDDAVFPGSDLANCQFMASDIETCQAMGKIITLSMGGATGAATFTSDAQAEEFATLIWNLFLGGTSDTRPFGDAVLDGIDLDIEGGGSTGLSAFVTQIRTLAEGASKPFFISAAPQCPFPDAFIGSTIDAVGFDLIYVQFYNNFCELSNFDVSGDFDFSTWDNWAKTTSPNPNVKVFLGAPAAPLAAGSGYVEPAELATIIQQTQSSFSSFGGVMLWDISQAVANDRYDESAKSALLGESNALAVTASSAAHATSASSAKLVSSAATVSTAVSDGARTTAVTGTVAKSSAAALSSTVIATAPPVSSASSLRAASSSSASIAASQPSPASNATPVSNTAAGAFNATSQVHPNGAGDSNSTVKSRFFKF